MLIKEENKERKEKEQYVPTINSLLSKYGTSNALSPEANQYIKELREILEDSTNTIKIESKKLIKPKNAILFKSETAGIIIIFENQYGNPWNILKNDLINSAIESAKNEYNVRILNAIIVTKHDYARVNQMANFINNCLMIYNDELSLNLTIQSFNKDTSLLIDTNVENVRSVFANVSPHEVMARSDIGLTCYMVKSNNQFQNIEEMDRMDLFSAVGYTEVVPSGVGSSLKLTPVIHVTDIITSIPSPRLLPIIQAVIAEVFAGYGLWRNPFKNFKKGYPNIGNYIIDPQTNKPKNIKTEQELNYFFQEYFTDPVVIFDITEGRARIPALINLCSVSLARQLSKEYKKFFHLDENSPDIDLISDVSPDIIGYANIKNFNNVASSNGVIDTRYIDYLNMVSILGYDNTTAKLFYKYGLDPIQRCNLISSIVNDVKFIYLNNEVVINGSVTAQFVKLLSTHVHIINPITNQIIQSVDVRNLITNAYNTGPILGSRRSPIPTIKNINYGTIF